jgi:hypothetical protein
MNRHTGFSVVAVFVGATLIGFSALRLYPIWVAILLFWFGCLAAQYRHGEPSMPRSLTLWHQACVLLFPIGSTILKWYLFANDIGSDVDFGNRIQHFSWAFCTVGLFLPTLYRWVRLSGPIQMVAVTIGFVSILGNLNEIAEWRHGGMQYGDTMKDLVMNIAGSLAGALVIVALNRVDTADGFTGAHSPRHRAGSRRQRRTIS